MKKLLFIIISITLGFQIPVMAQETEYEKPNWYFGAAAGANFNFYRGTTQQLNSGLSVPTAFHDGEGTGLYVAPLVEYHFTNSVWGIMLQTGYDNRKGDWDQVMSPCDCPMDLSSDLSYISIEPSLRLAPFKSGLYIYAGPRFAFNLDKSFSYEKGTNPAYPEQVADPQRNEDFDRMENSVISMQVGAGYDIPLSSRNNRNQFVLSPFVSFQPYFGQYPRSVESWNITTLRVGAALKFGRGRTPAPEVVAALPVVSFSINSPKNIPEERTLTETFPLSNYVFFNKESTEIPNRYVLLNSNEAQDFKEDQVQVNTPEDFTGRSKREMIVYYNVLNILGDRMGKNPSATVTLVGSSQESPADGKLMAASVKKYLVEVFAIDETRIGIEGRNKPKIPSEKPGGTRELDLLREGDRRVSIESSSPVLLMEFHNGPNAPLKPVQTKNAQEAPASSYVIFNADGAQEAFSSWNLQLTDENGKMQNFGPYIEEEVSISGEDILGTSAEGNYKVMMIGTAPNGEVITEESTIKVVKWIPSERSEAMRFSILYEFDDSNASALYEKYLSEVLTPKIPENGKVVIHGYTDIIGEKENNRELSLARANDVKEIIEAALLKVNRSDVSFDVHGSGEDEIQTPFGNDLPEERAYNRTVIIDLSPRI